MAEYFCSDTHLNSALSNTILLECVDNINLKTFQRKVRHVQEKTVNLKKILKYYHLTTSDVKLDPQETLFDQVSISRSVSAPSEVEENFLGLFHPLIRKVTPHLTKLDNGISRIANKRLLQLFTHSVHYSSYLASYWLRLFWEEGIVSTAKPNYLRSHHNNYDEGRYLFWKPVFDDTHLGFEGNFQSSEERFKVFLSKDFMIMWIKDEVYLASRNHGLMMSDCAAQRSICYMTAILAQIYRKETYPTYQELDRVFSYGDNILEHYKNDAYATLSLWEAIITAHVLAKIPDPAVDNEAFLREIKQSYISSQKEEDIPFLEEEWDNHLSPWINQIPETYLFQIFGLYRLWGHPTVNEKEGVIKLKSIVRKPRAFNKDKINMMVWKWREYFCTNYYQKHKQWPQMEISRLAPDSTLIRSLKRGTYISNRSLMYNLSDWRYVSFKQNFNIPEKFELSEMIADKATSHGYQELSNW